MKMHRQEPNFNGGGQECPPHTIELVIAPGLVMIVTPGPVLFLFVVVQFAKVAIIAMVFDCPLMVVNILVTIPAVIVVVVRIVNAIARFTTSGRHGRCKKSDSQQ